MSSSASIQDVFDELKRIESKMITREEFEGMVDSLAVLSNDDTMKQIIDSVKDIENGKVKEVSSVKDIIA